MQLATRQSAYDAGPSRLALRVGNGTAPSTLTYLLGDHLGSTLTFKADPYATTTQRSKPLPCTQGRLWGGRKRRFRVRSQSGTLPTQYTYTGQYSHTADFGLMYYVARWYDPVLGRFAQADTLVPGAGNPLAWDRYAYGLNNPSRYTDPSGHTPCQAGRRCTTTMPSSTPTNTPTPTPTMNNTNIAATANSAGTQFAENYCSGPVCTTPTPYYPQYVQAPTSTPTPTPIDVVGIVEDIVSEFSISPIINPADPGFLPPAGQDPVDMVVQSIPPGPIPIGPITVDIRAVAEGIVTGLTVIGTALDFAPYIAILSQFPPCPECSVPTPSTTNLPATVTPPPLTPTTSPPGTWTPPPASPFPPIYTPPPYNP